MQTIHGIRFLPIARLDGMLFGLDARWLDKRGLLLVVLLLLANPAGLLNLDGSTPVLVRVGIAVSSLVAFVLTSLGHELGHVVAGRLAGLTVRAVVLAPHGSMTIRAGAHRPLVDVLTALAGPLANALLGAACLITWLAVDPTHGASQFLMQLGLLQAITALANLVPFGPFDGQRIVAALRAQSYAAA